MIDPADLFRAGRPRPAAELVARGRNEALTCRVGRNRFLDAAGVACESEAKRRAIAERRIMQHAHIGYRSLDRTVEAMAEAHARAAGHGATIDRFGITLDWSMGYPPAMRAGKSRGTGIVLADDADFLRLANASPAAIHCGDFMLGLPAAVENTRAALSAGVTALGNLGQYFTFRLPGWDDDVATTEATVVALALIAAQDVDVLVHSNLDDGFAALFGDMTSSIGMVLIEKYVVERLLGARVAHCYGHHFSDPMTRHAFHRALTAVSDTPGTMIFGNTVSYRSTQAGNYASCASYLLTDLLSLDRHPSGHAVNPVPVTENERIPSVDEIVDAQVFASRLAALAPGYTSMFDWAATDKATAILLEGGRRFARNVLDGLNLGGVDTQDAAEMLLAIRRLGPRRLEELFGAGPMVDGARRPLLPASWAMELDELAHAWLAGPNAAAVGDIRHLTICLGATDVHEHGKYLVRSVVEGLGARVVDAGASIDPPMLVGAAISAGADAIAISTYNGIALSYARAVMRDLADRGVNLPVLIGGRLNEIRDGSNTDLPVDVTNEIVALGALPCATLDEAGAALAGLAGTRARAAAEKEVP
jgi:methylmalonyl-CoA mutase cobalamin-binding subunit